MGSPAALTVLASALFSSMFARAQAQILEPGSSTQGGWPTSYLGTPEGDYSPKWQSYFQVTESLPNVSWPLARNWAGNLPVHRPGHPNNTLFFWAFESSSGSFTENNHEPWGIWLNGGPGASSLVGLFFENGPIRIRSDYSVVENKYSWTNVADYVWIDQPVGTGFSTVDINGHIADEDQMGADFMGFLKNFIKVFPNLAKRPLYITGESYAGVFIPYIAKAYFEMDKPPVKLAGIGIGDGTIGSITASIELPVVSVLETYPQIIGYDIEIFERFKERSALCGYNLTLQYPQPGHFPTIGRADGCDLYSDMIAYAFTFTFPWSSGKAFDSYNIPDALSPEVPMDASVFLNDNRTRAAIHAPGGKLWQEVATSVFARTDRFTNDYGDPSVEPVAFLTDLATNATAHGVSIIIYSGNDDSLVPHFGSQGLFPLFSSMLRLRTYCAYNTTFGGIQGFTRKPATPWYNDAGKFGGIVHQERGWKYVLVDQAGHLLGYNNPISALTLVREFIFGSNQAGLVTSTSSGQVTVIGGEASKLRGEIMTGQAAIYYGQATTASSYVFPSSTVEAWNAYMATAIHHI
ncbi:alpha beta-hydrolase [Chiua virens]|nr:alpha beta-hydrolase [Chiua virens]